ncbi:MAG: aminotransferase class V-fold PLP-dependent enzyme [Actinomycetes bacterium]
MQIPDRDPNLPEPPLLGAIRSFVIGDDAAVEGPYGRRRVTYADYTASGRALGFIETFIRDEVLPRYANTHTESSTTGRQTTALREDARTLIRHSIHAGDDVAVIFAGSGATGAIDRLIGVLGLRIPSELEDRYHLSASIPPDERPVVFVGPFEHHSNELPWRESICDVVRIPEDADGHIDQAALEHQLSLYRERRLRIGAFSAASNVTGIVSDTYGISALLHRYEALAIWDFAAAGPYIDIGMDAPDGGDPAAYKDAIVLSPHKFVGGPGTPGVLAVRKALLTNRVPDVVGGGTVAYVNPVEHRYLSDPQAREEGGTPAIVESIRAGLVFQLKDAVGTTVIAAHETDYVKRAIASWSQVPSLQILGNTDADRLSIVSFVVRRPGGRYLHHNAVVSLLDDLFGVQARGGCSCAGPYGHALLGIDVERSHEYEREITGGCEGIKPGWVRVNFNYFIGEQVFASILRAVEFVAEHGHLFLRDYRFDPATGLWHHRRPSAADSMLRLTDVGYDQTGRMTYPLRGLRADESELAGYLDHARALAAERADSGPYDDPAASLSADFDALRWFELPSACLVPDRSNSS